MKVASLPVNEDGVWTPNLVESFKRQAEDDTMVRNCQLRANCWISEVLYRSLGSYQVCRK